MSYDVYEHELVTNYVTDGSTSKLSQSLKDNWLCSHMMKWQVRF